jgi:hypothetical protein
MHHKKGAALNVPRREWRGTGLLSWMCRVRHPRLKIPGKTLEKFGNMLIPKSSEPVICERR